MKLLSVIACSFLVGFAAFAVGSNIPLSNDQLFIAAILLEHQNEVTKEFKKAGVENVTVISGRSYEGGLPGADVSGVEFTIGKNGSPIGLLTISKSDSANGSSSTVHFLPSKDISAAPMCMPDGTYGCKKGSDCCSGECAGLNGAPDSFFCRYQRP